MSQDTWSQSELKTCFHCGGALDPLSRCLSCGATSEAKGYFPKRILAENPHSRMYLAEDTTGHQIALKELIFALVPKVEALDAFEREGKFLQRLEHPQIPRFVENFRLGSGVHTRLYLAQQFLEGETLAARIERATLSEAEFVDIASQVLRILIYLHGQSPKMIHRDIKPANIILQPQGQIALVDFGAARELTASQTYGSTLVGTFGYMPPEQLGGTVDQTSDLYALGASLLHAVTGKRPESLFGSGTVLDASKEKLQLSAAHRRFLLRLAEPRRGARYASASDALHELESPRADRRPVVIGLLAILAVCFLAALTQKSLTSVQASGTTELEKEALEQLRGLYTAEKSYYAEKDQYSADLRAIGFEPNAWCPDGARLLIQNVGPNEAVGCHFTYRVELDGTGPQAQFTLHAHGAAPPAIGLDFAVGSDGEQRGILQRAMRGK